MWQRVVSSQGSQQTIQAEGSDAQTDEQPPQPGQQAPEEPAPEQVEAGAGCWSCAGAFSCGSREEEGGEEPPKQQPTTEQQPPAEQNDRWKERGEIMRQGWLTCFKFAFQGLGLEFVTTCMAIMFVIILISGIMDMTGRLAVTEISKHAMNAETMAVLTQAELTLRTPIQLCVLMGRSDAPERGDTRFDLFANDTSYDRLFYAIGDVLDRTEYESYTAVSVSENGTVIGVERESSTGQPLLVAQNFGNGGCLDFFDFDENGLRGDLVRSDCSAEIMYTTTEWYADFLENDGMVGTGVYDWNGRPTLAIGAAHSQGGAVFVVLFDLREIRAKFQHTLLRISKFTSRYKLQALVTTQDGDVVLDTNTFPQLSEGLYTVDDVLAAQANDRVQQEMQTALRTFQDDFGIDSLTDITCARLNASECYYASQGPENDREATMVSVTAFPDDIAESGIEWTVYLTGDRRHMITYYFDALLYESMLGLFACILMGCVFTYFWVKASHKAAEHIETFEIRKHAHESDVETVRSLTRLLHWMTVKDGRANWTWLVYIICIIGISLISFNYWKQEIEEDVDALGEETTTTIVNSLATETQHTLSLAASTLVLIQAEVMRKGYLAVLPDDSYINSCAFDQQGIQAACSVVPSVSVGGSMVRFFDDHFLALQRGGLDTDYVGATLDNYVTAFLHEDEDGVRYTSISDNTTIYNGIPRIVSMPVTGVGIFDTFTITLLDQYKYWNGKEQEYFTVGAGTTLGALNWTTVHGLLSLSAEPSGPTLGVEAVLPFVETAPGLPADENLGVAVVSLVIDLKSRSTFANTLLPDLSKSIWTFITVRPETADAERYVGDLVAASEGYVIEDGVAVLAENSTSDTISRVAVEINGRFDFDAKRAPSLQRFPDGTLTSEFDPLLRVEYGSLASWSNVATIEQDTGVQWLSFCVLRIKPYYNVIERWQGLQLIFMMLLFGVLFARFQMNRRKFYKTIPKEPLSAYALTPVFATSLVNHTQKRDIPNLVASIHKHAEQLKTKVDPDSSVGLMVEATVKTIAEPDSFQNPEQLEMTSKAASENAVIALERQVSADSQNSDPPSVSPIKAAVGGLARFKAAANAAKFLAKTQTAVRRNKWEKFTISVWNQVLNASKGLESLGVVETPGARARRYLIDAYNFPERNVMKTLVEEEAGLASYIPERYRGACPDWLKYLLSGRTLYYIYTSHYYRVLCFLVIMGHMALAFWEAPAFDDDAEDYYTEYGTRLYTLNGLCTFWHVFDVLMVLRIFGIIKYTDPVNSSGKRISKMIVLRCVLVMLMAADYIQLCATEYVVHDFKLTDVKDTNAYESKLLPWSAPLRGVLLIVRHHELQASMSAFFVSIVKGRDILVVAFCLLTLGVCAGIAVLSGFYDKNNLALNFDDYRSAYIAMFTLIYTGENYPEALYPTFGYNRFFRAFFIIATFIGTFMLVAMIIASFERTYRAHLQDVQERAERGNRLAMFVAFVVLRQSQCDKDKLLNGEIPEDAMLKLEEDRHGAFYVECGAPSPDKYYTEIADEQIKREGMQAEQTYHMRKASGGIPAGVKSESFSLDEEKQQTDDTLGPPLSPKVSFKPFATSPRSEEIEKKRRSKPAMKRLAWDIQDWQNEQATVLQFVSWLEYLVYNDLIKFGLVYQSERLREHRKMWLESEAPKRALGRLKSATKSMISGISSRQVFEVDSGEQQQAHDWFKPIRDLDERLRAAAEELVKARYYNRIVRAMVFLNIMCVLFLGTRLEGSITLRNIMHAFVCFNILETMLRVYARGFFNYMFKDHSHDIFLKPAHQFDFTLILISIILYINTLATEYYKARGSDSPEYVGDIIFVIPTFRLVTILRTNRVVFFGLFTILRGIFPLLALLLIGIYIWAIVGVFLFCNLFEFMPTDEYTLTMANFNSVTDGMSTLFQVMTGESWDNILSMAMDTEYGYGAALYFITYVILVCTLFGPLFIGLIVDAYDVLLEELKRLEDESKSSKKHLAAAAAAAYRDGLPAPQTSRDVDRDSLSDTRSNSEAEGADEGGLAAPTRLSMTRLKRKQAGGRGRDILGRQMSRLSMDGSDPQPSP